MVILLVIKYLKDEIKEDLIMFVTIIGSAIGLGLATYGFIGAVECAIKFLQ